MSYYSGQSAIPVRPVNRRVTLTRGQAPQRSQRYLQKTGRKPLNRIGYPTMGTPLAINLAMEPGSFGDEYPAGYAPVAISQPSVPSVVAAPAPAPSTVWNPITSLLSLWDQRPQVLKDIRLSVNPNQVVRTLQNVVSPGQVSGAVNQLRAWGITPSYQNVPVTGTMAGAGYQAYGMNLSQYLPWIIGGGAILLLAPMLMGKR